MMGRGFEHNDIQSSLMDQRRIAKDPEGFRRELKSRSRTRLLVTAAGILLYLYFFWLK